MSPQLPPWLPIERHFDPVSVRLFAVRTKSQQSFELCDVPDEASGMSDRFKRRIALQSAPGADHNLPPTKWHDIHPYDKRVMHAHRTFVGCGRQVEPGLASRLEAWAGPLFSRSDSIFGRSTLLAGYRSSLAV